jgi:tetratricopeptide (TPR) repeat protein
MQEIHIFLASSIDELKWDRMEIGDYIRKLNDIYSKSGLYFRLHMCEDESDAVAKMRKQDEYNDMIRESQIFFVLFYTKAGAYTIEEFDVALEEFRKKGTPKIVTYFKRADDENSVSDDVKQFMARLDKELEHYYNFYSSLDTVKLTMILELARDKALGIRLLLRDGDLTSNGSQIMSMKEVPLYANNENLNKLIARRDELQKSFDEISLNSDGSIDIEVERLKISAKLNKANDEIHKIEMDVLSLSSSIVEISSSGKPVTERLKKALRYYENGDYEAVKVLLDSKEREKEAEQDEELSDKVNERHIAYIEENILLIKTLRTQGVNDENEKKIIELYEKAVAKAEKYSLDKDCMYDFVCFLYYQNKYDYAIKTAERLMLYYKLDSSISNEDRGALLNSVAVLYSDTNRYKEAEEYYKEALDIRRKLAGENPSAYNPDLAMTLNNLANLYNKTNKYKEAEEYYNEALDIYRKLAGENQSAYNPYLAKTLNNLAALYSDTNRYKEAEEYNKEALDIRRKLADENPSAYNPDLANTLNNLANLYYKTNKYKEAEEYYNWALDIKRKLAGENPSAYNPDLAMTLNNLAILYNKTNKYKEAEEYYKEALDIYRRLAGENPSAYNPYLAGTLNNLAILYKETNRYKAAEEYYNEALDIYRKLADENSSAYNPDLANTLSNLARLYIDTNRYQEAEDCAEEAFEIFSLLCESLPVEHPFYLKKKDAREQIELIKRLKRTGDN